MLIVSPDEPRGPAATDGHGALHEEEEFDTEEFLKEALEEFFRQTAGYQPPDRREDLICDADWD